MAKSTISVPVSTTQFLVLCEYLQKNGCDRDPVDVISSAIDYWMENASWKSEDLMPEIRRSDKGYAWKDIFLPHGTSIRMKYKNDWFYATVNVDQVIYDGKSLSPSEFANKVTGTSRNAWRDLWIKRPQDSEWIFADILRRAA